MYYRSVVKKACPACARKQSKQQPPRPSWCSPRFQTLCSVAVLSKWTITLLALSVSAKVDIPASARVKESWLPVSKSHNISNSHQCSKQPLVKRNRSSLQLQLGPFPHSSSRDCSKLILRKCNSLSPSPLPRPPKQLPRRCQLRPCLSSSSRQLFKLILVRCNGSKFNHQLLPWPRPQQQLPLRYQLSPPFGSSSSSRQPPKQTLVK